MAMLAMGVVDLVAIALLTIPLYYRRYRRRDLVTTFTVLNVAVFAVALMLGGAEVGIGLGMGLFGVLSIIRLRSTQISQRDIAYYFSSLSIGLIAGLGVSEPFLASGLIILVLVVVAAIDTPTLLPTSRHQHLRLGRAITDEVELWSAVEELIGGLLRWLTYETRFPTLTTHWRRRDKGQTCVFLRP